MYCANHPTVESVAVCASCEKPLCDTCVIHWKNKVVCKHCLETGKVDGAQSATQLRKSPTLAGFLSLMPGLGQAYVGYYKSGFIILLIVAAVITVLSNGVRGSGPLFGMFLAFFWIFQIIDAVRKAKLYNEYVSGREETIEPPSDSPLAGGVVLAALGLYLTLTITFDLDLDFLETFWPLAVLGAGIYLLWKYKRARDEMEARRDPGLMPPSDTAYTSGGGDRSNQSMDT